MDISRVERSAPRMLRSVCRVPMVPELQFVCRSQHSSPSSFFLFPHFPDLRNTHGTYSTVRAHICPRVLPWCKSVCDVMFAQVAVQKKCLAKFVMYVLLQACAYQHTGLCVGVWMEHSPMVFFTFTSMRSFFFPLPVIPLIIKPVVWHASLCQAEKELKILHASSCWDGFPSFSVAACLKFLSFLGFIYFWTHLSSKASFWCYVSAG